MGDITYLDVSKAVSALDGPDRGCFLCHICIKTLDPAILDLLAEMFRFIVSSAMEEGCILYTQWLRLLNMLKVPI